VLELESLQKTLTLSRLAIQKYDKPLCQILANTIIPEVLQCFFVLGELLDSIGGTWPDFSIMDVGSLCRRIWWAMLGGDEFFPLRKKLSYSRQFLQGLLMALHSYILLLPHLFPDKKPLHPTINMKYRMVGTQR
jgi:hypothetical protein